MGKRTILNLSVSDALSKRGKNLLVLLLMHWWTFLTLVGWEKRDNIEPICI
jgi:hypothetical protein